MSAHELDHLAIAVPTWAPAGALLNHELGARWASGFSTQEFNPCQLAVADDMRLELLEPSGAEHSFIQRFLDQHDGNAAPHHVTFKVNDMRSAIATAQEAGVKPILVNLQYRGWQEAFLHPKDTGLGFLAQMVQTAESIEDLAGGLPNSVGGCPWEESRDTPCRVEFIHGFVTDLDQARHVLVGILGASEFQPDAGGHISGFRWETGADLLLTQGATAGIDSIGILPAGPPAGHTVGVPDGYPTDLPTRLRDGTRHPELGIRICQLFASTVSAGS